MANAPRGPASLAERDMHDAVARGATANPMMRNLMDAAPQEGDDMRLGRLREPEDQATRQFKVCSAFTNLLPQHSISVHRLQAVAPWVSWATAGMPPSRAT